MSENNKAIGLRLPNNVWDKVRAYGLEHYPSDKSKDGIDVTVTITTLLKQALGISLDDYVQQSNAVLNERITDVVRQMLEERITDIEERITDKEVMLNERITNIEEVVNKHTPMLDNAVYVPAESVADDNVKSWAEFFKMIGIDALTASEAQKKENKGTRTEQVEKGIQAAKEQDLGEWKVDKPGRSFSRVGD